MQDINNNFKNAVLIGYLAGSIADQYPDKQVGKTIIQKMIFFMIEKGMFDFDYSMYHYGPYSAQVENEIDFAEKSFIINISWVEDKGYYIQRGMKYQNFAFLLSESEKEQIDRLILEFGHLSASELSILATGLFMKNRFDVAEEDLPPIVHEIKPKYSLDAIRKLLSPHNLVRASA
jgi:uncharacterized protein YwgA